MLSLLGLVFQCLSLCAKHVKIFIFFFLSFICKSKSIHVSKVSRVFDSSSSQRRINIPTNKMSMSDFWGESAASSHLTKHAGLSSKISLKAPGQSPNWVWWRQFWATMITSSSQALSRLLLCSKINSPPHFNSHPCILCHMQPCQITEENCFFQAISWYS